MHCEAGPGDAGATQFLDQDEVVQLVRAGAAVFLGNRTPEQASFAGLAPDIPRHDAIVLPLGMKGGDLDFDETPYHVAELLMVTAEQSS
ncbi:hypothetical protein D9M69_513030 [compost metagenome]